MKKPIAAIGTVIGLVTLGLGIAGFFLPGLPPAPLLFVALLCVLHFCPPFVAWFLKRPVDKSVFDQYIRERSMTRRNKIKTLLVSALVALGFIFVFRPLWAKAVVAALWAAEFVYIYFFVWTNVEDGHGLEGKAREAAPESREADDPTEEATP